MKHLRILPNKNSQKGQSLVEVALFFPVFLIMLAGLVEIANMLVTQNRVTSATRSSTRFAADGGEDAGMSTVLLNTVTQTLSLNDTVWDIWAIRGEVNEAGNAIVPASWSFSHIYGISNTVHFPNVDEEQLQEQILDELMRDEYGNLRPDIASDIKFVATYAIHDIDSILGLDSVPQLAGLQSIRSLTVMRIIGFSTEATNGCDAFPIGVSEGLRSVTPPNTGGNPFPQPNEFQYPLSAPVYANFIHHTPDMALSQASEGDLFKIHTGLGSGSFAWLIWNTFVPNNEAQLRNSLTWPGNSRNYSSTAPGAVPPGHSHGVFGYLEPGDPTDNQMHIGDWVAGNSSPANSNNLQNILRDHIDNQRTLRFPIWNSTANGNYRVNGFAVFRLVGYHLTTGGADSTWILAEFIRLDSSCGQVLPTP